MKIRPKVRYVYWQNCAVISDDCVFDVIRGEDNGDGYKSICSCSSAWRAQRVCSALNLHEAVRRGEIKVSK